MNGRDIALRATAMAREFQLIHLTVDEERLSEASNGIEDVFEQLATYRQANRLIAHQIFIQHDQRYSWMLGGTVGDLQRCAKIPRPVVETVDNWISP